MSMIEAIGTDLKMSIDDLIHEIKTIQTDVEEIRSKIELNKSEDKGDSN